VSDRYYLCPTTERDWAQVIDSHDGPEVAKVFYPQDRAAAPPVEACIRRTSRERAERFVASLNAALALSEAVDTYLKAVHNLSPLNPRRIEATAAMLNAQQTFSGLAKETR